MEGEGDEGTLYYCICRGNLICVSYHGLIHPSYIKYQVATTSSGRVNLRSFTYYSCSYLHCTFTPYSHETINSVNLHTNLREVERLESPKDFSPDHLSRTAMASFSTVIREFARGTSRPISSHTCYRGLLGDFKLHWLHLASLNR